MMTLKPVFMIAIVAVAMIGMITPNVFAEPQIPFWVNDVAKWWWEGQISDEEIIRVMNYLTEREILHVSASEQDRIIFLENEKANISANNLLNHNEGKPSNNITNFAIVGDMSVERYDILDLIESIDPELVFFAGDLGYSGAQSWFDFSDGLANDFHIVIGNHETDQNTVEEWLSHYDLEKEFYSVDYHNVHFLVLASDSDFSPNSEQIKFVESDLIQASSNPEIDWIITVIHRPLYSSAPENSSAVLANSIPLRNAFQPIFDLYDVDMVVQGHVHSYERTKPLMFNNTITDNSTMFYPNTEGQIYTTVGTGGIGLRSYIGVEEWSVIQNSRDFGILNIKVTGDNFISAEFLTNKGKIFDFFQIYSSEYAPQKVNLSASDLSGIDLSRTNLVGANISNSNLTNVDLSELNLSWANLSGSDLSGMDLTETILTAANLSNVDLSGSDLSGIDLTGVDLSGSDLSGMDLTETILTAANLSNVDLSGSDLSGIDLNVVGLSGSNLFGANLTDANFSGSDLSGNDLSGTILTGADLSDANLSGVNLSDKDLREVNLSGVKLSWANLRNTNLSGLDLSLTNLYYSNLSQADLSNTNITKAILNNAKIINANLQNANLENAFMPDVNLSGANLQYAYLSGANLINANLQNANLENAFMSDVNLSGANLNGANLNGANLNGANLNGANLVNLELDNAILECINHSICN